MMLLNFSEDDDMSGMKRNVVLALAVAAAVAAPSAFATNGYFSHGYGMKALGSGGAATAMTEDAFGGANNPATMVWVGNRYDIGVNLFSPKRDSARTGAAAGSNLNGTAGSESTEFFIPEFGYNTMINPNMSFGVTVYGNGGMNTNYPERSITSASGTGTCNFFQTGGLGPVQSSYNLLCGNGSLGVDLAQLIIAPTLSYKIGSSSSVGISPLIGYQRFKADGLQAFAGFSRDPGNLTNNGYASSTGLGLRVGWMTKLSDSFNVGAAYATKMSMSKFYKYAGLFAEEGDFDMPSNYNVGIAFKAIPKTTIALDYQRINYTDVKSVSNPSTNGNPAIANTLGGAGDRGFGWSDIDIFKLGVQYQYSSALMLRAGYDHTDNPIQSRDVTFNILAPGVVQDHLTLGFTYNTDKNSELTMAYMHAFQNDVSGPSLFNTFLGAGAAGNEKIEMYQNSLGIAWSNKW